MTNQEREREDANKIENARRQAEGIRVGFANRDEMALREMNEAPPVEDYFDDLQAKMASLHEATEGLRKSIMEGGHKSGDIEKKIAFQKQLNEAENKAYHAFSLPEEPWRVASTQQSFENAADNLARDHIEPTARMARVLNGEEVAGKNSDETGRLKRAEVVTHDLPAEEVGKLKAEIDASMERLQQLKPEVEKIAKDKMLPPGEKEDKLKQYAAMHENYQKMKKDLYDILNELRK